MNLNLTARPNGPSHKGFDAERMQALNSCVSLQVEYIRTDPTTGGEPGLFYWREKRVNVMVFRRPVKGSAQSQNSQKNDFYARETRSLLRVVHSNVT